MGSGLLNGSEYLCRFNELVVRGRMDYGYALPCAADADANATNGTNDTNATAPACAAVGAVQ